MNKKIIITGGAGFIGSNVAKYYMDNGYKVIVFDNFSRPGVKHNIDWLKSCGDFIFIKGDVTNESDLKKVFEENKEINLIHHQAAQVAVTLSINDPKKDFESNALGTFNVLEAVKKYASNAVLIYSSTNKVYGNLNDLGTKEKDERYEFADEEYKKGINEDRNLDFHSPYGCSKGAADQYVRDYSRIYGLKTVVFRQSCIYGYRQIGLEDQGWVAWFLIQSILNRPVTLYGTGKQVRDVLFIDDLVNAYQLAEKNINKTAGKIYNMGGGYNNSLSLLEFVDLLEGITGKRLDYSFGDWIFIANTHKAKKDFGWDPKIDKEKGIEILFNWLSKNKKLFK